MSAQKRELAFATCDELGILLAHPLGPVLLRLLLDGDLGSIGPEVLSALHEQGEAVDVERRHPAVGGGEDELVGVLQARVLERNVSTETVIAYKAAVGESLTDLASAIRKAVPELGESGSSEATRTIVLLVGTVWTHAYPPQAVQDAYTAFPRLTFLPDGFAASLERSVRIALT